MNKLAIIAFLFASSLYAQVQIGKGVQIGGTSSPTGAAGSTQINNNGAFGSSTPLVVTGYVGADLGAQMAAAIAACPADGCSLLVPDAATLTSTSSAANPFAAWNL